MIIKPILIFALSLFYLMPISAQKSEYETKFEEITSQTADTYKSAFVDNITFSRESIIFSLSKGELFFCKPVGEHITAAIFYGSGAVDYEPPIKLEQDQLFRYLGVKKFHKEIEYLFLFFSDSTSKELLNKLEMANIPDTKRANRLIEESLKYLYDIDTKEFHTNFMKSLLENNPDGFFHAHFKAEDNDIFSYQIDPYEEEEICFNKGYSYINHKLYDNINQFSAIDDKLNRHIKKDKLLRIEEYKINSFIDDNKNFTANTTIYFQSRTQGQKWFPFSLYSNFDVDSVKSNTGKLEFFKGDESEVLWIKFDSPPERNKNKNVSIYYRGDLLRTNTKGWVSIRSSGKWFPKFGIRNYAQHDITFKYPQNLTLVCVGENISNEIDGEYKISRWKTDRKIRNVSFNIGSFREHIIKEEGLPEIFVYHSRYGHRGGITDAEEVIGEEIKNSIEFFQNKFGKLEQKKIYASEIPYYHGEAFPGFLHLSFTTFQITDYYGIDQIFRAHEVAHQWWAVGVDFETYHDQWLSEAFAEYSGLMYLQHREGTDKMLGYLDEYKNKIVYNRQYFLGDGQEPGPIYLGYRTFGRNTKGDYDLMIYKKGAWVLHMLRMMLIDLETLNDDAFSLLMRDFYNSYVGGIANTKQFISIAEKHFNNNLDWFFNQWIYDIYIPEIKFAYKIVKAENGNHYVKCRINIDDLPDGYKLYPIIKIIDSGNELLRFRVPVSEKSSEFDLQLNSFTPEKIVFNDLNSVLCEISYEDWDDLTPAKK